MKYGASLVKLIVFIVVTLLLTGLLVQTIGNISFDSETSYKARFADATGLFGGNDVRIAGVKVGTVTGVKVIDTKYAEVSFTVKKDVKLYSTTSARIRYLNLIGGRFLAHGGRHHRAGVLGEVLERHGLSPVVGEAPRVLFLNGLTSDAECLGDLREGPAIGHGALNRDVLDAVGEATERSDGSKGVGRIIRDGELCLDHGVTTLVDERP